MTDTDLRSELEARTAHLHLDRPVEAVLARGDRIRRRRRTAVLGGVVGVVAALGVVALSPDQGLVDRSPSYVGEPTARPGISLEDAHRACGRDVDLRPVINPAMAPVAFGVSGDGRATLAYHVDDESVVCTLRAADERVEGVPELIPVGTLLVGSMSRSDWALDTDTDIGFVSVGRVRHRSGSVLEGDGVARVSDDVDRVVVTAGGRSSEALVEGGFVLFWLTEELTAVEFEAATLTAYDSTGGVLAEVGLT